MGSIGASQSTGSSASGNRPFQQGGLTSRRATQRGVRAQGSAAISAEEFQRATGVNPRTGRRTRRG